LLAAAHANPGTLTLGAVGPGTAAHIGFEMLKREAKLDMIFVAYQGNAPAVTAVLGSHVSAIISGYAPVASQLQSGTLRALAIGSAIPELPDVPSLAAAGFKDVEIDNWFGVVAPAKTPPEKLAELSGWFTQAMEASDVKPKLASLSLYPHRQCGADFAVFIRQQSDRYGRIIRAANIRAD
jgi:tripartite-type tricarboxylate transporter receptor subunit TctC